jgi:hypothetical protein
MLPVEMRECDSNKERRGLITRGATISLVANEKYACMGIRRAMKNFTFDGLMSEGRTTEEVFECTGAVAVREAARGVNAVVFAFGQSGSGKTYTMLGEIDSSSHSGCLETKGTDSLCLSSRSLHVNFSHAGDVHAQCASSPAGETVGPDGGDANMNSDIPGKNDTEKRRGIAIMTYEMLRDALRKNVTYVIQCAALQVYLGHVYDLLAPDPAQPLILRAHTVSRTLTDLGGEV